MVRYKPAKCRGVGEKKKEERGETGCKLPVRTPEPKKNYMRKTSRSYSHSKELTTTR